ncbi:hypothetical protein GZ178_01295 [Dermatophilus congolensis]|nr:hypothetical protein [Dermatophilus congolensis]MBO3151109.1 hypothetical protein [Dermatophilus congolensis]MBO3162392.1 hypothetical protein [Dermatophilus congolensis]MBO3175950.1 hypothetical protein [Dermatophilus congolensis]MBO3182707.1 hypothetical protein [Dermatophilus congolensis]MBO3205228.1 hypothetical protein [Dermatophilus congolensis]
MDREFSIAELARQISSCVENDLTTRHGGPRAMLRKVALRPVDGIRTWRTPLPQLFAAGGDPSHWQAVLADQVVQIPGVAAARPAGKGLDVELELVGQQDHIGLLPTQDRGLRLWLGCSSCLAIEAAQAGGFREKVFVAALRGCALAVGDRVECAVTPGQGARVTYEEKTYEVICAPVQVDGQLMQEEDVSALGTAALAWALLLAVPARQLALCSTELLARKAGNAAFVVAHARLRAALTVRSGDEYGRGDVSGSESRRIEQLSVLLVSWPFVLEQAVATASPRLVARYVLAVGELVEEATWLPVSVARSVLSVIDDGVAALGTALPHRV